jgi:DNA-binding NarL/FixJ family response regulator
VTILLNNNDVINEGIESIFNSIDRDFVFCQVLDNKSLDIFTHTDILVLSVSRCTEALLEYCIKKTVKTIIVIDIKIDRLQVETLIKVPFFSLIPVDSSKEVFVLCAHQVCAGYQYIHEGINQIIINDTTVSSSIELSGRETEILNLLAMGNTLNEISEQLYLSINTVITHKRNILKKTGFNKMTQLIAWYSNTINS